MATTAYVGQWRPHRPRGPIGAHFKSPGPKYMLPGSTGFKTHDLRKRMAPSFSFGTRHAKFTDNRSPGPGSYLVPAHITKTGVDGTPRYSLYGRKNDIAVFKTPGPGTYSPEKSGRSAYHSAPIYSLSSRMKGMKHDNSPGPAAYMLPKVLGPDSVGKSSLPCYSLTSRRSYGSFHDDLQRVGPAAYSLPAVLNASGHTLVTCHTAPSYTLSGRHKIGGFSEDLNRVCGPAAYSLPTTLGAQIVSKTSAPGYSMTGRAAVGSFHEDLRKTPGPGTYRVIEPWVNRNRAPLYSMTGRNMLPSDTTQKPGPGAHSPEKVRISRQSAPNYSFGIRHSEYIAPLIDEPH